MIQAIPTTYGGTHFRSRLEARWAAFFDLIGWRWTYEPLVGDGYIPDFMIHGERPFFVEIGPCATRSEYREKALKAHQSQYVLRRDVLVLGVDVFLSVDSSIGDLAAGWFGEWSDGYEGFSEGLAWGFGNWCRCEKCGDVGVWHADMWFASRPCGHYLGGQSPGYIPEYELIENWREAGNDVQWRPAV